MDKKQKKILGDPFTTITGTTPELLLYYVPESSFTHFRACLKLFKKAGFRLKECRNDNKWFLRFQTGAI